MYVYMRGRTPRRWGVAILPTRPFRRKVAVTLPDLNSLCLLKIHQGGVQWKQGVVVHIIL